MLSYSNSMIWQAVLRSIDWYLQQLLWTFPMQWWAEEPQIVEGVHLPEAGAIHPGARGAEDLVEVENLEMEEERLLKDNE